MPIYEYRCPKCKAEVERLQRMSEAPPRCEACYEKHTEHIQMERKVSKGSFILKGGGWADEGYG